MRRNYSTNNYRSLRENADYRSRLLYEQDDQETGMSIDTVLKRVSPGIRTKIDNVLNIILKMQKDKQELIAMYFMYKLLESGVVTTQQMNNLAKDIRGGEEELGAALMKQAGIEQPEEEPMEKMESRYRSGSRLNESRRSVQRPNRRYNY